MRLERLRNGAQPVSDWIKPMTSTGGLPTPTASELAILRVLWRLGPSTVRKVHGELAQAGATGYTTVLKFLPNHVSERAR